MTRTNRPAIKQPLRTRFRFNLKLTVFAGLLLPVLLGLGFWQLDRANWKTDLLAQRDANRALPPVLAGDLAKLLAPNGANGPEAAETPTESSNTQAPEQPADPAPQPAPLLTPEAPDRRALLDGRFDAESIYLLDNRVLRGQVGFEVLQRFHDLPSGQSFFVNRGFARMGRTRSDLPAVETPSGRVRITTTVYPFASSQLEDAMASEPPEPGEGAPAPQAPTRYTVIQRLDELPTEQGFCLRLDLTSVGALPRYWPSVIMTPAVHRGYAIQWFAMAGALALLWIWFSFPLPKPKKREKRPPTPRAHHHEPDTRPY